MRFLQGIETGPRGFESLLLFPDAFFGVGWLDDVAVWVLLLWYCLRDHATQADKEEYNQRRQQEYEKKFTDNRNSADHVSFDIQRMLQFNGK